jgi:fructose-1,6-bisphosphatase/inositol monophosphatase family enzyme
MPDLLPHSSFQRLLDGCRRVAAEAGAMLGELQPQIQSADISAKSTAFDLVSRADTEAEGLIRERLARLLPEAAFMGEESDSPDSTGGLV